ncbi:MAG: hypothetical protein OD815_001800 [Candidatus Alkanophagales archaeon MCA70_species_2]|nr:hypothetical protein [Candidatus Alkanophaga liquidiphilum]
MEVMEILRDNKFILVFTIIALLCTLDVLTTHYVISNSIGYEGNELLSDLVSNEIFYFVKYFVTILMVIGIASLCGRKYIRLRLVSYLSIIGFYTIVVLNNILVITMRSDLNLNLPRLFAVFSFIFILAMVLTKDGSYKKSLRRPSLYSR